MLNEGSSSDIIIEKFLEKNNLIKSIISRFDQSKHRTKNFALRISSVNVTTSTAKRVFDHIVKPQIIIWGQNLALNHNSHLLKRLITATVVWQEIIWIKWSYLILPRTNFIRNSLKLIFLKHFCYIIGFSFLMQGQNMRKNMFIIFFWIKQIMKL